MFPCLNTGNISVKWRVATRYCYPYFTEAQQGRMTAPGDTERGSGSLHSCSDVLPVKYLKTEVARHSEIQILKR